MISDTVQSYMCFRGELPEIKCCVKWWLNLCTAVKEKNGAHQCFNQLETNLPTLQCGACPSPKLIVKVDAGKLCAALLLLCSNPAIKGSFWPALFSLQRKGGDLPAL